MNINKRYLKMMLAGVLAGGVLLAVPLLTQEDFDPSSVKPRGCTPGTYTCGLKVLSQERQAAIPVAESSLVRHRGLPSSADFSRNMPPIGNQGQQSSCVAWASGYAAKSYLEKVERKWSFDSPITGGAGNRVFSPAFIYNQINGGRDGGSYIHEALGLMVSRGATPWRYMPYSQSDYRRRPSGTATREAAKYKNQSYRQIQHTNLNGLKAELARGNPIVFGMPIDDAFYNYRGGVYAKRSGKNYGGHAMTLVGYDDNKSSSNGHRGAFKIINSWGTSWGERGYGWISYRMWNSVSPHAYVTYDKRDTTTEVDPETEGEQEEIEQVTDEKPAPPGNVRASQGTYSNKVRISWSRVNGAGAYALARAPANSDDFDYLGYSTKSFYDDASVQPGVAYQYVVVTFKSKNVHSDPEGSKVVQGYASQGQQKKSRPDQVIGLEGSPESSSGRVRVVLNWSAAAGADKYQIARRNGNRWKIIGTTRNTNYLDKRPVRGKNIYSVRGVNSKGSGQAASAIQVNAGGGKVADGPPSPPSGVQASRGQYRDKIVVRWNASPGASKYFLFRYDYNSKAWEGPRQLNRTSYTDNHSSVRSGKNFAYIIVASNSAGHSKYSRSVIGKANPSAARAGNAPDAPEGLTASIKGKQVVLKWKRVKKASSYYVFRTKKDGTYDFIHEAKSTSYTDTLPEVGELYFYIVRARGALAESGDSNSVAAVINKPVARHRTMVIPGQGFEKFKGTWQGMVWQNNKPQEFSVTITGKGNQFNASIKTAAGTKNISGQFASHSTSLNAGDFRMSLNDEVEGAAQMVLSGRLSRREVSVGLSKL